MFYRCNSLSSVDLSKFNTSSVRDMDHLLDRYSGGIVFIFRISDNTLAKRDKALKKHV